MADAPAPDTPLTHDDQTQAGMRWQLADAPSSVVVNELATSIPLEPVLARLLAQRGVKTYDEAEAFFKPDWHSQHDPFLMLGMETAVLRLARAVEAGEKVGIFGDYDVDGTTAVAICAYFFSRLRMPHFTYQPDRYAEGYGLSKQGIDAALKAGCKVMLVLDCGTKDLEACAYAQSKKLDIIVCDHHLPGEALPHCLAMLNPKQAGCPYPFKELSGAGVGYKLLQGLNIYLNLGFDFYEVADLLALSIACDLVEMSGENRLLAFHGLEKLRSRPGRGISALMDLCKTDRAWEVSDLVFFLGPRINAAGRMAHASKALPVLLGQTPNIAEAAQVLEELNAARKEEEAALLAEAIKQVELLPGLGSRSSIVVRGQGWHKGLVGIIAAKLVDRYHRPAIVLSEEGGTLHGSARSITGVDVHAALEGCASCLTRFGGHTMAAGMSLQATDFEAFSEAFEQACSQQLRPELLRPLQVIDAEVGFDVISERFVRILGRMAPNGPGHRKPVFLSTHVHIEDYRVLRGGHIRLSLRQEDVLLEAIAFGADEQAHWVQACKAGTPVAVAYVAELDSWNGRQRLQLRIKDIKPMDAELFEEV